MNWKKNLKNIDINVKDNKKHFTVIGFHDISEARTYETFLSHFLFKFNVKTQLDGQKLILKVVHDFHE
jgi:hypothetical protein